tara:strand:+ start:1003 stop:1566 length:564 start_codon:yes stop_codon:yes gene_type:complete
MINKTKQNKKTKNNSNAILIGVILLAGIACTLKSKQKKCNIDDIVGSWEGIANGTNVTATTDQRTDTEWVENQSTLPYQNKITLKINRINNEAPIFGIVNTQDTNPNRIYYNVAFAEQGIYPERYVILRSSTDAEVQNVYSSSGNVSYIYDCENNTITYYGQGHGSRNRDDLYLSRAEIAVCHRKQT